MKKARVKRLICVIGFGASDSRAKLGPLQAIFFQLLLGRAYDDKDVQETIVRRSGLDWIIVRPVILTSGPKTRRYKVLCDPKDWARSLKMHVTTVLPMPRVSAILIIVGQCVFTVSVPQEDKRVCLVIVHAGNGFGI
jgi:hypothetical protein